MNLTSDPRRPLLPLSIALEDDDVRELVSCTVRRAVPAMDADDVAQGVYCDALGTRSLPSNPVEIPYWLAGIARHHVANYFRRRPREVLGVTTDVPAAPATFESREALDHVFEKIGEDAEAKRTLDWMVLEHEGTPLKLIAEAERLSPAAVRARVYRMRSKLRRELAYLLAGVLVCAGVGAGWREWARTEATPASAPRLAFAPAWAEGDFEVTRVTPADDVDPGVRARLSGLLGRTTISVRGSKLEVRTPMRRSVLSFSLAPGSHGQGETLSVVATDEAGRAWPLTVRRVGETVLVDSATGEVRGSLVLQRIDPQRERETGK
jgi:DNA-directed RNA polymerase specialized sigma24 family protein